jgi:hypothetical protein
MVFREIVAVYCEKHTEHVNTLSGQNAVFHVKAGSVYSYSTSSSPLENQPFLSHKLP